MSARPFRALRVSSAYTYSSELNDAKGPRMKRPVWLVLAVVLIGAVGILIWQTKQAERDRAAALPPVVAPEPASPASAPVSMPPSGSVTVSLPPPEKPISAQEVAGELEGLLGGKAVSTYLQIDQFARRLVATVDNLGRAHAPVALWPLHPTPGRFTVDDTAGALTIGTDNAARYTPLVLLVETIDVGKAADLYLRLYPLLQQEYLALGYPGREFNDRLLEVIDLLLATPELEQPPKVELLEIKGPVASLRPWVRYQYADPTLEALASGQKILIRVGTVNQRRLKQRLTEFRDAIIKRAQKR